MIRGCIGKEKEEGKSLKMRNVGPTACNTPDFPYHCCDLNIVSFLALSYPFVLNTHPRYLYAFVRLRSFTSSFHFCSTSSAFITNTRLLSLLNFTWKSLPYPLTTCLHQACSVISLHIQSLLKYHQRRLQHVFPFLFFSLVLLVFQCTI